MLGDVFIIGGCRTPIGGFGGALASVSAVELGATVIRSALSRAGLDPHAVDEVILGNVISAGQGQNIARQAALRAGLPDSVGAMTINKVCGSGLKAVMLAAQAIQCGDASIVVAVGAENMSAAPYLLHKARNGYRMGHGELTDALIHDGLWDTMNQTHMGNHGDATAARCGITRQQQDDFAVTSYQRARAAQADGAFDAEIVPVQITGRKGEVTTVTADEEPSRFDEKKLRTLRPAFGANGTVTAGNASSINDGAAACVVISGQRCRELGLKPDARILGYSQFACEPRWFTLAPLGAIGQLLKKLSMTVADVDLFEINEAFSAVVLAAMQEHQIPHEKVNILGGSVALGHPIGTSGTRTLVTLLNALKRNRRRIGVDALCIGGGEAVALAVESLHAAPATSADLAGNGASS